MRYLVNFSTGLASFEAARRTIKQKGRENTTVIFCDVRGDAARDSHAAPVGSNWDGEDDDNYRFLADAEKLLGVEIVRLKHPAGLGVWGAIFQHRAISIRGAGGLMFAPCARLLKMKTADAYAAKIEREIGDEITRVLGLTWMEDERVLRAREKIKSDVWFPLCGARQVGALDWGGCGCFAPSPQMRFDEIALEAATPRSAIKRPLAE